MPEDEKSTAEKVADRLSGNGIVKATRICIDGQKVEYSDPVDFEQAKIDLDHQTQEVVDNVYILEDSWGNVEIVPGNVLPEDLLEKIAEEFL